MSHEGNGLPGISQLEAWMPKGQNYPAGLYIVATPVGNLADITLRALWVLQMADVILCEDTRITRKLLSAYGIRAMLMPYHEHNAEQSQPAILEHLRAGKRVALVSDAGTPLISDPGYKLVQAVHEEGIYVTSIPGASSVILALTLAGLPTDHFLFCGFLPPKVQAREKALQSLRPLPYTLVFLEAPHRLSDTLEALHASLGERDAALLRELTKRYETAHRAPLSELSAHYRQEGAPKGEIVLVVAPPTENRQPDVADIDALLAQALETESVREASSRIAQELKLPRKTVYARALALKGSGND